MITSVKQEVRYTPRDLCDDNGNPLDGAPVYIIETPDVRSVSQWNQGMLEKGARHVPQDVLLAVMRRGINDVGDRIDFPYYGPAEDVDNPASQTSQILAFLDDFEASSQELENDISQAQRLIDEHGAESEIGIAASVSLNERLARHASLVGIMDDLEDQMCVLYPPYRRKLSMNAAWMAEAPILAFEMFVVGGENTDVEIRRERGRVPNDVLNAIPRAHLRQVGWHAAKLMSPSKDDAKNSERPTSAADSRKPSGRVRQGRGTSGAKR